VETVGCELWAASSLLLVDCAEPLLLLGLLFNGNKSVVVYYPLLKMNVCYGLKEERI
jgi:hypothetical protein